MSKRPFRSSASAGAWVLAIVMVALLVESPRLVAIAIARPSPDENVIVASEDFLRVNATERDPSVPAASSVSFDTGDANVPAMETF